jgi:hypothetical protein
MDENLAYGGAIVESLCERAGQMAEWDLVKL